jgi:hypothetical protein
MYNEALANGWLLKDANGNYIHTYNDPNEYMVDFGDPAYQQRFLDNILTRLAAKTAIDGIEADNIASAEPCGWAIATKYANATSWQLAMLSFVTKVGGALKARGYHFNINSTDTYYAVCKNDDGGAFTQDWYRRLGATGGVSSIMYEYWLEDPTSTTRMMDSTTPGSYMHSWDKFQQLHSIANSYGIDLLAMNHGDATSTQKMRYGRGSFMLDWDGVHGAYAFCYQHCYTGPDPWNTAWTSNLGSPTGPKSQGQTGVWRRSFVNATVVVNTTLSSVTVNVNGTNRTIGATDAYIGP